MKPTLYHPLPLGVAAKAHQQIILIFNFVFSFLIKPIVKRSFLKCNFVNKIQNPQTNIFFFNLNIWFIQNLLFLGAKLGFISRWTLFLIFVPQFFKTRQANGSCGGGENLNTIENTDTIAESLDLIVRIKARAQNSTAP